MNQRIFKYWIRYKISKNNDIDRFFEDYPKLHHYIEKHNIKEEDIIFIKTKINRG